MNHGFKNILKTIVTDFKLIFKSTSGYICIFLFFKFSLKSQLLTVVLKLYLTKILFTLIAILKLFFYFIFSKFS